MALSLRFGYFWDYPKEIDPREIESETKTDPMILLAPIVPQNISVIDQELPDYVFLEMIDSQW